MGIAKIESESNSNRVYSRTERERGIEVGWLMIVNEKEVKRRERVRRRVKKNSRVEKSLSLHFREWNALITVTLK